MEQDLRYEYQDQSNGTGPKGRSTGPINGRTITMVLCEINQRYRKVTMHTAGLRAAVLCVGHPEGGEKDGGQHPGGGHHGGHQLRLAVCCHGIDIHSL